MHVLLNWLVQGTALTFVVALGVRMFRTMNAATRERIWWITIICVALMPVAYVLADFAAISRASALSPPALSDPWLTVRSSWTRWTTLVLAAWAAWSVASGVRMGLALVRLQQAKKSSAPFPRDREARLPMWNLMRNRARPATLVVSARVHRAAVLGLTRPLIAVSPDAMAQLTDEELDQIVLHEYAHIQRHDDVGIVGQRMISILAGFHPAVWWLDRALTIDREIACDDWVVTYAKARTRYARCLIKLASCASPSRWTAAPGVVRSRSQLTIRVTSLLDRRRSVAVVASSTTLLVALSAVLALVVASVSLPLAGVARDQPLQIVEPSIVLTAALPDRSERSVAPAVQRAAAPKRRSPMQSAGSAPARPLPASAVEVDAAPELLSATALAQFDLVVEPDPRAGSGLATPGRDSPWDAATDVGMAIGNGSRNAALKTAEFFSRVGHSFANGF